MKPIFLLFTTLLSLGQASAQNDFKASVVDEVLLRIPAALKHVKSNIDLVKAIEAVDKNYRQIVDTLYEFKSLPHTIFQNIWIETTDSIHIDPLSFGDELKLSNILFYHPGLNTRLDSLSKTLRKTQRTRLYDYLTYNYHYFSPEKRKLSAQPVRIRYLKFPDERFVHVGIDIYGAHFLWTIARNQEWNIIKVERLWVY